MNNKIVFILVFIGIIGIVNTVDHSYGTFTLGEAVKAYSQMYNVNECTIKSIIHVESKGNPSVIAKEHKVKDKSYGLMQIRLKTAKYLGFQGKPEQLLNPILNLHYGVKYLSYHSKKYKTPQKIAAAYNAGSVRYTKNKEFVNKGYVSKFNKFYNSCVNN